MKLTGTDVFTANEQLKVIDQGKLEQVMEPANLMKKGFTMSDIGEVL